MSQTPKQLPDSDGLWLRDGDTQPVQVIATEDRGFRINGLQPTPGRWLKVELPVFEPLKELPKVAGVPCVVRYSDGLVSMAERFNHRYVAFDESGKYWWTNCVTVLTSAECEAAGYRYPEECQ